jgi:phage shock protein A
MAETIKNDPRLSFENWHKSGTYLSYNEWVLTLAVDVLEKDLSKARKTKDIHKQGWKNCQDRVHKLEQTRDALYAQIGNRNTRILELEQQLQDAGAVRKLLEVANDSGPVLDTLRVLRDRIDAVLGGE